MSLGKNKTLGITLVCVFKMLQVPQVYEPRINTIKIIGEKHLRSYFETNTAFNKSKFDIFRKHSI